MTSFSCSHVNKHISSKNCNHLQILEELNTGLK